MRFTDLVFDLYGTLVDIHTDEDASVWNKTAMYFGFHGAQYSGQSLSRAFRRRMSERKAAVGRYSQCYPDVPVENVMAQLFRDGGISENADALGFNAAQFFRVLSIDYIRPYPYAKQALAAFREAGHRLWLLSNAQRVFTEYELKMIGLNEAFDGIYISSHYGCRKPDSRFFRALLDERGLDPRSTLMIGNDRYADILGARALGLATFYMHTNISPSEQPEADPKLSPGNIGNDARHYEYEGSDWSELFRMIADL